MQEISLAFLVSFNIKIQKAEHHFLNQQIILKGITTAPMIQRVKDTRAENTSAMNTRAEDTRA